jgi:hypothetical protein
VDTLEGGADGGTLVDDADQVNHGVAPRHAVVEALARHHVALDALDGAEAPEIALGAAADETAHGITLGSERLDHGATDEARATGNKDPAGRLHGP